MKSRWYGAALIAIVTLSVALATIWLVRVPMFEEPDELAHFDYVMAFFDVGRPFTVASARRGQIVMTETRTLAAASRYRRSRYDDRARYAWYGSASYYAGVDRRAPGPSDRPPASGTEMPYVAFFYPAGYYAIAATIARTAYVATHGSLVAAFFATRALGVGCLGLSLLLTERLLRSYGIGRRRALLAVGAIGTFPLTSWVAGYAQPDNLTWLCLNATLYLARRWQRLPGSPNRAIWLGMSSGALFFVKQQFAIAAFAAVGAMVAGELIAARSAVRARIALGTLVVVLVPLVAFGLSFRATPVGRLADAQRLFAGHGSTIVPLALSSVSHFGLACILALADAFVGPTAHDSYWFRFGFKGASFFPHAVVLVLRFPLLLITLGLIVCFIVAERRIAARLVRIARRRSWRAALRLALGFVPATTYLVLTAILVGASVALDGGLELEGRYWLPVIVPAFLIVLLITPRVASGRSRRRLSEGLAWSAASYSLIAAPLGVASIQRAFYEAAPLGARAETVARFTSVTSAGGRRQARYEVDVPARRDAIVRGFAVDLSTGLPATAVPCRIGGRALSRATTGFVDRDLSAIYNDEAILRAGFELSLPARAIHRGTNVLTCSVRQADGRTLPFAFAETIVGS